MMCAIDYPAMAESSDDNVSFGLPDLSFRYVVADPVATAPGSVFVRRT
jgi:hypothetical protein